MATIYTKTALKKIKKDELIQMFLDQQGKLNDINMSDAPPNTQFLYKAKVKEQNDMIAELKENEKELAYCLAQQTLKVCQQEQTYEMLNDSIEAQTEHTDKVEAENEKLKAEIDDASYREDSMFQTLTQKRKEESDWAQKKIEGLQEELDVFRKSPAYAAVIWERDCLKEENEKLKEEVNDRVVIEDIAAAFGREGEEDFDWENEIHNLKYTEKLKEEIEGFRSVCNEYLQDESSTWEELRNWCDDNSCCDDLRDTIADMEDQLEEKEVDKDNMIDFIERSGGWGDYQEFVLEHCQ